MAVNVTVDRAVRPREYLTEREAKVGRVVMARCERRHPRAAVLATDTLLVLDELGVIANDVLPVEDEPR